MIRRRAPAIPHASSRVPLSARLGYAALLVLASFGVLLFFAALFGELYAGHGQKWRTITPRSTVALKAAELGSMLAPWRAGYWRDQGLSLAKRREDEAALAKLSDAIRWAPADAGLWVERSRRLARAGRFGRELGEATQRARALAPHSCAIELALAVDGMYYWRFGSPEQRELWLDSMRFSLRRSNDQFLRAVAISQRESLLCGYVGKQLEREIGQWCYWAPIARATCARDDLKAEQKRRCWLRGFLPGQRQ